MFLPSEEDVGSADLSGFGSTVREWDTRGRPAAGSPSAGRRLERSGDRHAGLRAPGEDLGYRARRPPPAATDTVSELTPAASR